MQYQIALYKKMLFLYSLVWYILEYNEGGQSMGMAVIMAVTLLMSAGMIALLYYVTKKAYSRKWDEEE